MRFPSEIIGLCTTPTLPAPTVTYLFPWPGLMERLCQPLGGTHWLLSWDVERAAWWNAMAHRVKLCDWPKYWVALDFLILHVFFFFFKANFYHEGGFNKVGCPWPDNNTIKFTAILWIITACIQMIRCYVSSSNPTQKGLYLDKSRWYPCILFTADRTNNHMTLSSGCFNCPLVANIWNFYTSNHEHKKSLISFWSYQIM